MKIRTSRQRLMRCRHQSDLVKRGSTSTKSQKGDHDRRNLRLLLDFRHAPSEPLKARVLQETVAANWGLLLLAAKKTAPWLSVHGIDTVLDEVSSRAFRKVFENYNLTAAKLSTYAHRVIERTIIRFLRSLESLAILDGKDRNEVIRRYHQKKLTLSLDKPLEEDSTSNQYQVLESHRESDPTQGVRVLEQGFTDRIHRLEHLQLNHARAFVLTEGFAGVCSLKKGAQLTRGVSIEEAATVLDVSSNGISTYRQEALIKLAAKNPKPPKDKHGQLSKENIDSLTYILARPYERLSHLERLMIVCFYGLGFSLEESIDIVAILSDGGTTKIEPAQARTIICEALWKIEDDANRKPPPLFYCFMMDHWQGSSPEHLKMKYASTREAQEQMENIFLRWLSSPILFRPKDAEETGFLETQSAKDRFAGTAKFQTRRQALIDGPATPLFDQLLDDGKALIGGAFYLPGYIPMTREQARKRFGITGDVLKKFIQGFVKTVDAGKRKIDRPSPRMNSRVYKLLEQINESFPNAQALESTPLYCALLPYEQEIVLDFLRESLTPQEIAEKRRVKYPTLLSRIRNLNKKLAAAEPDPSFRTRQWLSSENGRVKTAKLQEKYRDSRHKAEREFFEILARLCHLAGYEPANKWTIVTEYPDEFETAEDVMLFERRILEELQGKPESASKPSGVALVAACEEVVAHLGTAGLHTTEETLLNASYGFGGIERESGLTAISKRHELGLDYKRANEIRENTLLKLLHPERDSNYWRRRFLLTHPVQLGMFFGSTTTTESSKGQRLALKAFLEKDEAGNYPDAPQVAQRLFDRGQLDQKMRTVRSRVALAYDAVVKLVETYHKDP